MIQAIAVVGSEYPEGKGKFIEQIAIDNNASAIVRFNAGFTNDILVKPKGGSVFKLGQYAAGAFRGIKTHFLGQAVFFLHSAHQEKMSALHGFGIELGELSVDPNVKVITPWDIALAEFVSDGTPENLPVRLDGHEEVLSRVQPQLSVADISDPIKTFHFAAEIRAWFKDRIKQEAEKGSFTNLDEKSLEELKNIIECPSFLTTNLYSYCALIPEFRVRRLPLVVPSTSTVILQGAWPKSRMEEEIELVKKVCEDNNFKLKEVYTGFNTDTKKETI